MRPFHNHAVAVLIGRVLGEIGPHAGHGFACIGRAGGVLHGMVVSLIPGANIKLTQGQPRTCPDQPRRSAVEMFFPESFRIEERAVIEAHVFVDEDVALVVEMWPEIQDARIDAGFEVDVKEGHDDLAVEVWKRVLEPPLHKFTTVDVAVVGDIAPHLIECAAIVAWLVDVGFTVERIARGQPLEGIANDMARAVL